jgi:prophage regulatory protein
MAQTDSSGFARILNIREVCALNSLSRASIYRGVAAGTFPRPVRLTSAGRRVGWRSEDVQAWMDDPLSWRNEMVA